MIENDFLTEVACSSVDQEFKNTAFKRIGAKICIQLYFLMSNPPVKVKGKMAQRAIAAEAGHSKMIVLSF